MTHQINLLQTVSTDRGPRLSLPVVLAAVLVTALVMAGLAWQAAVEMRQMRERVTRLEQLAHARTEQDAGMAQAQLVSDLEHRLELRKTLIMALQAAVERDRAGFAEWFRTLAHASTDGTWLVGADIDRHGATLHGRALTAERVPAYLGRLEGEAAFAGKSFNTVEIDANPDKASASPTEQASRFADALGFTLSTRDASGEKP